MRVATAILWCALALETAGSLLGSQVGYIQINGAIGPATAGYISRAIDVSTARQDACLIIELDTPGGLLDSTEEIVKKFFAARVPTVVYVAPSGARAASAGCFITMAADIAAMAPGTRLGAAHPVSINPTGGTEKLDDTMKQKIENDTIASIENIARRHGRNVEWAKSAVKESASITADEAVEIKVVDLIAKDIPELLQKIDGREVNGHVLKTAGATVTRIPMAAREKLFQMMARPEVMFILMLAAIYGLIGELTSPGAILPGVVGAIAFILALYLGAILPVSLAGIALLALAVTLFIVDIFAPTHGVLTAGGVIAFFLGALLLFNKAEPGFRLSLAYIIPGTVLTAGFFIFVVGAGLRAQSLPVRTGREAMLGKTAAAISAIGPASGKVFVEGEYWNAVSESAINAGQPVEIVAISGLTLKVKPTTT